MKMTTKTRTYRWIAALTILITICLPSDAMAFLGLERSRTLKQADLAFEQAQTAGTEGRILDEITSLTEARDLYGHLLRKYPGYKAQYVDTRFRQCSTHLRIITARIKSGELTLPEPDVIVSGGGEGYVVPNTLQAPTPAPTTPVKTIEDKDAVPTPPPPPIIAAVEPPPPPVVAKKKPPRSQKTTTPPATPVVQEAPAVDAPSSALETLKLANDTLRCLFIKELFDMRNGTEAVLLLEDLIKEEGENASEATRLLLIRALLECRNYKRAEAELAQMMTVPAPSIAMRSLASAIALQKGEITEAIYQTDRILQECPSYSDAYVNMAYLYLTLDPEMNRGDAIIYYRGALAYGARRDPALEIALRLEIIL